MKHLAPASFRERAIRVDLAGCGGNGSQVLVHLAKIHRCLLARGHPEGLHVRAFDPDRVSEANVGRQLFAPGDIGDPKCDVLINRVNAFWGLNWEPIPERWSPRCGSESHYSSSPCDVLITCVDTAAARREIHRLIHGPVSRAPHYWLDLGNSATTGQAVMGQCPSSSWVDRRAEETRLRTVTELFPELLDPQFKDENRPSCSLAEALTSQDLFINPAVALAGCNLLWKLLGEGLDHASVWVNLTTGEMRSEPITAPKPAKAEEPQPTPRRGRRRREGAGV